MGGNLGVHRCALAFALAGCASASEGEALRVIEAPEPVVSTPPQVPTMNEPVIATAPIDRPRPAASPCAETIPYALEEDGTTPRQGAMFARGPAPDPWPRVQAWLAAHGHAIENVDELGPRFDVGRGSWSCERIVRIDDTEHALCSRAFLQGDKSSASAYVLLEPHEGGLRMIEVGTHALGMSPPPGMSLGPYVRLDLHVDGERLVLEEAAPGTCAYACGHAQEVERTFAAVHPEYANATAVIANACADQGTYVVRGGAAVRIGEPPRRRAEPAAR